MPHRRRTRVVRILSTCFLVPTEVYILNNISIGSTNHFRRCRDRDRLTEHANDRPTTSTTVDGNRLHLASDAMRRKN